MPEPALHPTAASPELVACAIVLLPVAAVVCLVAAPVILAGALHKTARRHLRKCPRLQPKDCT